MPRIGITRRSSDSWALGSIVHSAVVRSVGGLAPTYGDAMSDGIVPTLPELVALRAAAQGRSEEHTSELQSLMRISYAVFCLKKKIKETTIKQSNMRIISHRHPNRNVRTTPQ